MNQLGQLVQQLLKRDAQESPPPMTHTQETFASAELGRLFYSGQYRGENASYRWELQDKQVSQLLQLDGDKSAKVLVALAHKQRLDILRLVLQEPLNGPELVERLNMGTTGQLYHHMKALVGADLLVQEERGGTYAIPGHRVLPLLLLLAATSDLMDTTDYIAMTEVRTNAPAYLGGADDVYNPHLLLWAVVENSLLEHQHGTCTETSLILHEDGSITVSDNGRGIPVDALPGVELPRVQSVLTDMSHLRGSAQFFAPGSEKGISMPVVNALSSKLAVTIKRDGCIFQQHYKHGIPQSVVQTVGVTKETGTSVTFLPDRDIFHQPFDFSLIQKESDELALNYPNLTIRVWSDSSV
ncbi:helix-turn-helix domain-containing protein [Paenibacillus qinlingensis]|nr:helix-turn-helix domain-containing protein [Paenibacillus qinlingensis]